MSEEKLRLRFEKSGRAVYISHLDLMRTMQRGFQRAGLSLKYSEGFNPHPTLKGHQQIADRIFAVLPTRK